MPPAKDHAGAVVCTAVWHPPKAKQSSYLQKPSALVMEFAVFGTRRWSCPTDVGLGMHAVGLGAGQAIKADEAGAVAPGLSASITNSKQSAADFDAEQAPVSSFILNGVDYSHHRSVRVHLCCAPPALPSCCYHETAGWRWNGSEVP